MSKTTVLIQIDSDPQASTFDSIVAIDSGVDHLLTHQSVTLFEVQSLVHGAMFTRGGDDMRKTALFFGGSDVQQTEALVRAAKKTFFGPVRVSLMSDPNGSNTTAAAAVLCSEQHLDLAGKTVTVLAATGPVGFRIVQLASWLGATVRVCSRRESRAQQICDIVRRKRGPDEVGELIAFQTANHEQTYNSLRGSDVVYSAGAAGVEMVAEQWLDVKDGPSVAVDLNAVPPVGIFSIDVMDKAVSRGNTICYGAVGVGGLKMKIHRRCIQQLFETNDQILEIEEIYGVGKSLLT